MLPWVSDQRVWVQGVLDLLWLQGWGKLQWQQSLHHVVAVRRRRALAAGALCHLTAVKEVVALHDEGLDDGLVQLGGRQRVLVLEVGPHERGPEADGQVVGRHQRGLAVLAHPEEETGAEKKAGIGFISPFMKCQTLLFLLKSFKDV